MNTLPLILTALLSSLDPASFRAGLAPAFAKAPAGRQDPAEKLQKKVEACSKHISERFVFFGSGSGVLIGEDGLCLTNHHVVAAGFSLKAQDSLRVQLHSGSGYVAKLVCTDETGDVALYKLQGKEGEKFPFVEFGDSDKLEPGRYVVACGNPFGLAMPAEDRRIYPTITLGIVSALHRYQESYFDCIQTDASVNPGNSGGPLVTLDGRLVGINGRIATRYFNRVNSGVGYAIPSNQIRNFLPQMMKGGQDKRIFHGRVYGLSLYEGNTEGKGALVTGVATGSTAHLSGFRRGDLIRKVNDYPVPNGWRAKGVLGTYPAGTEVSLHVLRDETPHEIKVVLDKASERGGAEEPQRARAYLGVTVEEKDGGVVVTAVRPASPADDAGLQVGDVVLKVDGRDVKVTGDVTARVASKRPGDPLKLRVKRGEAEMEIEAKLGRRPAE